MSTRLPKLRPSPRVSWQRRNRRSGMAHKTRAVIVLGRISRANGSFLLVSALIAIVFCGCTPNRAYRDQGPNPSQDQFVRGHQENQYEPYTTAADQNHHFDFSYIDVDEKGD